MNSILRSSVCVAVAVSALFAAGCPKKPLRPNPSQTMLGGLGGEGITPLDVPAINENQRDPDDVMNRADFSQLPAVLFDYDSAAIRVSERAKVEQAASYVKANPGAKLLLVGRCDWRGTTEYNMGLGDRRGRSVKDFLATFGISAASVEVVSKGDLDAREGGGESDMQQDRRVDVGILR